MKDETIPDTEAIFSKAGPAIKLFNENTQCDLPFSMEPSMKSVKKGKFEKSDAESDQAILNAIRDGVIATWTVVMLTVAVQRREVKITSKKKADLVAQVTHLYG